MFQFTRALARLALASALVLILALLATGTVLLLWPETALTLLLRALGVLALTGAALLLGGFLARG